MKKIIQYSVLILVFALMMNVPVKAIDEESTNNTVVETTEETPQKTIVKTKENKVEKYVVSYLNTNGIVEFTRTYEENDSVDLTLRLGGGEKQLGWSTTQGGSILSSYKMPSKDIKLYPVIDTTQTTYKVSFELQNRSSNTYEVKETITLNGKMGDSISADDIQNSSNKKSYVGYTYNASESSKTQQMKEGTVVRVRFDANKYTIQLDINGNYKDIGALYYATLRMNIDGTEYTGTGYTQEVYSGETFTLPTASNVVDNPWLTTQYSDYFKGWTDSDGNTYTNSISNLASLADSNGIIKLRAKWAAATDTSGAPDVTLKYHIYQQKMNSTEYEFVETITKTAKASALTTVSIDGYEGFTYKSSNGVGDKTSIQYGPWYAETTVSYHEETNVYFDRNNYALTYKVNNEIVKTETIPYQASLNDYKNYVPENKPSTRAYLDGWYDEDDIALTDDQTMPAQNITVYGTWKYGALETKMLSYHINGGEGTIETVTVGKGSTIRLNDGTQISKEGYTFKGWNTQIDGNGTTYNANSLYELNDDTILYAVWEKDEVIDDDDNKPTTDDDFNKPSDDKKDSDNQKKIKTIVQTSDTHQLSLMMTLLFVSIVTILQAYKKVS